MWVATEKRLYSNLKMINIVKKKDEQWSHHITRDVNDSLAKSQRIRLA